MEYEVDLRRYALMIIRRWRLILLLAVSFAIVAGAFSLLQPKSYVASAAALLIIKQTGTAVSANEPILNVETIDVASRRASLIGLAQSTAIEANLPPEVIAGIGLEDYKPGMLLADSHITLYPAGDLLEIRAASSTPEQAQLLANAWMETYVDYVTPLYTDGHSEVRAASTAVLPFRAEGRDVIRNAALSGFAGLLFGIILALLLELVRRPATAPRRVENERVVGGPAPTR